MKRHTKKGVSFVEMIIAISIFSLLMIGLSVLFARLWSTQRYTIETGLASFAASRGVSTVIKDIRSARQADNGAFAIESGDDFEIIFYANIDDDADTERVRYFLNTTDDVLQKGVTDPNTGVVPPTYNPGADEVVTDIAGSIVNDTGTEPMFEYFDTNSAQLTTPITPNDVTMVKMLLFANPSPGSGTDNVRIQSFATMRNLSDFD